MSTHAVENQVNGHWIALASLSPSRDEVYTLATDWRWVQCYAPQLEDRTRPHLKPTNKSWRVDETYVRIRGHWFYLYRAVDSTGATIDFFLSAVLFVGKT